MKASRIVMVAACPFPANHGSPASIREMSEALVKLGHSVFVVTYPIREDIPVDGVKIRRVLNMGFNKKIQVGPTYQKPVMDLLMVSKLCRVIWKEKIDLIHAHNYEGAIIGYLAKLITGRPLLYNAVNTMIDELPSYNFIRPKSLAIKIANFLDRLVPVMADYIITVSRELSAFLLEKGVDKNRITVVPAGVNSEMFEGDHDAEGIRRQYRVGSNPLVVYTGTLDPFQGIDYLLRAMRDVIAACPEAKLMLVGNIIDRSYLDRYRQMARELEIEDSVIFTEKASLQELPSFLSAADVVVLPRLSCPGHPVKLLNYMAAGKAIVSFAGSGKGLRHLYNGFIAEDGNCDQLGQGILRLLRDRFLREGLGRHASESIQGNFDWFSLAKGISVIYAGLIDAKKGRLSINEKELYQFIKRSYEPVLAERRQLNGAPFSGDRRHGDRRRKEETIDFLDRRKMTYL